MIYFTLLLSYALAANTYYCDVEETVCQVGQQTRCCDREEICITTGAYPICGPETEFDTIDADEARVACGTTFCQAYEYCNEGTCANTIASCATGHSVCGGHCCSSENCVTLGTQQYCRNRVDDMEPAEIGDFGDVAEGAGEAAEDQAEIQEETAEANAEASGLEDQAEIQEETAEAQAEAAEESIGGVVLKKAHQIPGPCNEFDKERKSTRAEVFAAILKNTA